jgi:hypothetical protein
LDVATTATDWTELLRREHLSWLAPWTERVIGAAAAAVLAVGVAGAALVGGRERPADGLRNLAAPALDMTTSTGESAAGLSPVILPPIQTPSAPVGVGRGGSSFGTSTGSGPGARSTSAPVPRPAPTPESSTASPSTPSSRSAPTAPSAPVAPPAPEQVTQVGLGVPGVVEVGAGECTGVDLGGAVIGCDPQTTEPLEVQRPGLPPLP